MNKAQRIKFRIALALFITVVTYLCFLSYSVETEIANTEINAVFAGNTSENAVISSNEDLPSESTKKIDRETLKGLRLIPGGMPFGMCMKTEGIVVSATSDVDTDKGNYSPSGKAGIKSGDIITALDSNPLESSDMLFDCIANSDGMPVILSVLRDGKINEVTVTPAFSQSEKEWKIGLWIKDSARGIGTVTFLNPDNSYFAGLGHAICDSDSGIIMPFRNGKIFDASISGVKQSVPGSPGELHGTLTGEIGIMSGNTFVGVYGNLAKNIANNEPLSVAPIKEVKEGKATILCTLYGNTPKEFEINIASLTDGKNAYRDMIIEVTDSKLLSLSGGIVQGMSGSPIIQNGKIVGAVTHVLIDNPNSGYGVYAENMLSNMPELYS